MGQYMGLYLSPCWWSRRVDLLFWQWPEGISVLQQAQENKELQGENEPGKQIPKHKGWSKMGRLRSACNKIQFCLYY